MSDIKPIPVEKPLDRLNDWEEDLQRRYPAGSSGKRKEAFRDYEAKSSYSS